MPASGAVEPTIISCAPPASAPCICSSDPRLAEPNVFILSLPSLIFSSSCARKRAARPWTLSSFRP
jgi:hypothetical protein